MKANARSVPVIRGITADDRSPESASHELAHGTGFLNCVLSGLMKKILARQLKKIALLIWPSASALIPCDSKIW
jgi:hypothetical protein